VLEFNDMRLYLLMFIADGAECKFVNTTYVIIRSLLEISTGPLLNTKL
jgi:hypothetical protein